MYRCIHIGYDIFLGIRRPCFQLDARCLLWPNLSIPTKMPRLRQSRHLATSKSLTIPNLTQWGMHFLNVLTLRPGVVVALDLWSRGGPGSARWHLLLPPPLHAAAAGCAWSSHSPGCSKAPAAPSARVCVNLILKIIQILSSPQLATGFVLPVLLAI